MNTFPTNEGHMTCDVSKSPVLESNLIFLWVPKQRPWLSMLVFRDRMIESVSGYWFVAHWGARTPEKHWLQQSKSQKQFGNKHWGPERSTLLESCSEKLHLMLVVWVFLPLIVRFFFFFTNNLQFSCGNCFPIFPFNPQHCCQSSHFLSWSFCIY